MKLLDCKVVKVGTLEFPIKITNRSMIDYEKLSGAPIGSFDSTEKLLQFFYCTAKPGAKSFGKVFDYTFDQFLDLIDDDMDSLNSFTQWAMVGSVEKKQTDQ